MVIARCRMMMSDDEMMDDGKNEGRGRGSIYVLSIALCLISAKKGQ